MARGLIAKGGTNARDATSLATARDDTLAEYVAETRRVFETEARLDADGSPVEITLRTFPTPPEVRMRAAQASATHEDHPGRVQLRFESSASLLEARTLAVTLPRSLGPVLVTFVQPSTRLAATTGPAQFVVLGAPRIISTSDAAPPTARAWAAAAACALALLGLLAPIWTRRRALALERRAGSSPKHSGRPSLTVPPSLK